MIDGVIEIGSACSTAVAAIQIEVMAAHVVVGAKIGFSVAVVGLPNFKNVGIVWVEIQVECPLNRWVLVANNGGLVIKLPIFKEFEIRIGIFVRREAATKITHARNVEIGKGVDVCGVERGVGRVVDNVGAGVGIVLRPWIFGK